MKVCDLKKMLEEYSVREVAEKLDISVDRVLVIMGVIASEYLDPEDVIII